MKRLLLSMLAVIGGCDGLPRDTDGTLQRIQAEHAVRVGIVSDGRADGDAIAALIRHVATAADARVIPTSGAAEPLLAALDAGQLDLVVGAFGEKTPWRDKVTLAPPVGHYAVGRTRLYVRAAVRNGENKWAMLVEQAARDTAPQLASEE